MRVEGFSFSLRACGFVSQLYTPLNPKPYALTPKPENSFCLSRGMGGAGGEVQRFQGIYRVDRAEG